MKFLAALVPALLDWLLGKLADAFRRWQAKSKREEEIKQGAEAVREKTEKAETPEERDEATKDSLRNW